MRPVALLAALALSGCAGGSFWHQTEPDFRPVRIDIVDASPRALCTTHPEALACAVRNPIEGTCTIYLPRWTPDYSCVLVHELRHCAGFDHPNFTYTNAGCF